MSFSIRIVGNGDDGTKTFSTRRFSRFKIEIINGLQDDEYTLTTIRGKGSTWELSGNNKQKSHPDGGMQVITVNVRPKRNRVFFSVALHRILTRLFNFRLTDELTVTVTNNAKQPVTTSDPEIIVVEGFLDI